MTRIDVSAARANQIRSLQARKSFCNQVRDHTYADLSQRGVVCSLYPHHSSSKPSKSKPSNTARMSQPSGKSFKEEHSLGAWPWIACCTVRSAPRFLPLTDSLVLQRSAGQRRNAYARSSRTEFRYAYSIDLKLSLRNDVKGRCANRDAVCR